MGPLISGLISGGASLIGGLLDKPKSNKGMNSSIRKSNREAVAKANTQNTKWAQEVQARANKAAKVPIVTKTSYGSQDKTSYGSYDKTSYDSQQKTSYGSQQKTSYDSYEKTSYGSYDKTSYGSKQDTTSYVDVDGMMKAAERSGFNPVTFLQAGGLQAYTRTQVSMTGRDVVSHGGRDVVSRGGKDIVSNTGRDVLSFTGKDIVSRGGRDVVSHMGRDVETLTGSTAMEAATVGINRPAFSYYEGATDATQTSGTTPGQAIGNALGAGVNTYLAANQQLDQNNFQRSLVQMQLDAANRQGTGRGYSIGGVPRMSSSHGTVQSGGGNPFTSSGELNYKGIPLLPPPEGYANYEAIKAQNETLAGFAEVLDAVEVSAEAFWDPANRQKIQDYTQKVLGLDQPYVERLVPGSPADIIYNWYKSESEKEGTPYRPKGGKK